MVTVYFLSKKRTLLGFLFFLLAGGFNSHALATEERPTLETIKNEFSHELPSMWTLGDLILSDAIYSQDAKLPVWKAKIIATIVTGEDTYLPTEYGLGTMTVLRPIYKAGVKRKLFARVAARKIGDNGWQVAFLFDNEVTLSAGLPMSYFVGPFVVEGSEEFKTLGTQRLTSHIDAAIKEQEAALAKLKTTHAAEVESLKQQLNTLGDIELVEMKIKERIDKLQGIVSQYQHKLDKAKTQLDARGVVINQWVSSVRNPFKDLPKDKDRESNKKKQNWSIAKPELILGAPDSQNQCSRHSGGIDNAWSPSRIRNIKGTQSIEVEFSEAVIPTELTVYEVGNYRFVQRLTFHGSEPGKSKTINVYDVAKACPGESVFQIIGVDFPARAVTIEIDTDHRNPGDKYDMEGIDAVKLTGVAR